MCGQFALRGEDLLGHWDPVVVVRPRPRAREDGGDRCSRPDDGAAEDVQVGEKAKWLTPKDNGSCALMILDGNAVLLLEYKPADEPAPRSQEYRRPLRELAKSFYDAVQTR